MKQNVFKASTIKVSVPYSVVVGKTSGYGDLIDLPNKPLSGFKLSPGSMSVCDPRDGINGSYSIHPSCFSKITISKGEVLDELVYGISDIGMVYVGLADEMGDDVKFCKIKKSDIGKRVIVHGREKPVTYAGHMRKFNHSSTMTSRPRLVHVYRDNSGSYFFSRGNMVTRITKTVDPWKTHTIIKYGEGKTSAVLALNPTVTTRVVGLDDLPPGFVVYRMCRIRVYDQPNRASTGVRVPVTPNSTKAQQMLVIKTPGGVFEV